MSHRSILTICIHSIMDPKNISKWQASDSPFLLNAEELDLRMKQRIKGENRYIDGKTFSSASTLSKVVRTS